VAREKSALFRAFREDHALLGKGFFEVSKHLRGDDLAGAHGIAERLNREAGAHIAFEEENFYPVLACLLGDEVNRFYREHELGREVIAALCMWDPQVPMGEDQRRALLEKSEAMESHIAECGDLFEAMGRIPPEDQEKLFDALLDWRRKRPTWLDYNGPRRHETAPAR